MDPIFAFVGKEKNATLVIADDCVKLQTANFSIPVEYTTDHSYNKDEVYLSFEFIASGMGYQSRDFVEANFKKGLKGYVIDGVSAADLRARVNKINHYYKYEY